MHCPLRSIVLYAPVFDLDTKNFAAIRDGMITFAPRQIFAREGEIPRQVYSLYAGWAFQYRLLGDGRRQIFSFLLPGDFIGVRPLNDSPLCYSVQALTRVEACSFDTDELARLFQGRNDLKKKITTNFYQETSLLASRLVDVGRRTATERIIRLILEIEGHLKSRGLVSENTFPFPLRQTHIADALGLTAVHVNRTINVLRREGLITFRRGSMTLEDRNALMEIAGLSQ